jgi:hypothetical protein
VKKYTTAGIQTISAGLHYNGAGIYHTDIKGEAELSFHRTKFHDKYELDRQAETFLSWSPGERIQFKIAEV